MRPNATDRYLVQFKPWGVNQPFETDSPFRDGELEAAKLYVDRTVTALTDKVKAGRVWDCDTEQIVYGPVEAKELDLGFEHSRDNKTCQPGLFETDPFETDW